VHGDLPQARVRWLLVILLGLIFQIVYISSFVSYFMFFHRAFWVSLEQAQFHLFAFLGAVAAGTFIGGPVGDRFGRKRVILGSIVGILPFAVALPYLSLFWTTVLSVLIGLILSSAFSAILVYAQELVPTRVGLVSGLFFGCLWCGRPWCRSVGMGGRCQRHRGRVPVVRVALLGLIALWLPDVRPVAPTRS
jgi:FSR family fosmidomycin resistance protein-like MFS transporter